MLKRHGWTVSEAHDGLAGVAAAARERFDLILMDISMPRLDGLEATRRIRAGEGRSREAPIVALTAHALPEERCRVAEAGMQDLLIKPLRQKHLATLLDRLAAGTLVHGPPMADANGTPKQDDDGANGDGGIDGAHDAGDGAAGPPHDRGAASQDDAAAGVDEEILDASVPGELAAILGAAEFDRRLDAFLAEMRGLPEELAAIWRGGSLADVRERAHAANGSAALFGAVRLNDVLGTLEEACMDDEPDFVDPLIEELTRAVEETERAVAGARGAGLVPAGAAHASR
jgi:CheY-like chemotaxis protein